MILSIRFCFIDLKILLEAASSTVQHVSGNAGVALRATEEIDEMLRHTGMSALKNKLPC